MSQNCEDQPDEGSKGGQRRYGQIDQRCLLGLDYLGNELEADAVQGYAGDSGHGATGFDGE